MGLCERCRHHFSEETICAGDQLAAVPEGVLVKVDPKAMIVYGFVTDGEEEQACVINWSEASTNGGLGVFCYCGDFEKQHCRHLWATIATIDQEALAAMIPGGGRLSFHFVEPEEEPSLMEAPPDPITQILENGNAIAVARQTDDLRYNKSPSKPWEQSLSYIRERCVTAKGKAKEVAPTANLQGELRCRVSLSESATKDALVLRFFRRPQRKNGTWGKMKSARIGTDSGFELNSEHGQVFAILLGLAKRNATASFDYQHYYSYYQNAYEAVVVPPNAYDAVLPALCRAGLIDSYTTDYGGQDEVKALLTWDDGPLWQLSAEMVSNRNKLKMDAHLVRGTESVPLHDVDLILSSGLLVLQNRIARWDSDAAGPWVRMFQRFGNVEVPTEQSDDFASQLWSLPVVPEIKLPPEMVWTQVSGEPKPMCRFQPPGKSMPPNRVGATILFSYDGVVVPNSTPNQVVANRETKTAIRRDFRKESEFVQMAELSGFSKPPSYREHMHDYELPIKSMSRAVAKLLSGGWQVQAEGKLFRRAGEFRASVRSGLNWFELTGKMDFDGQIVELPELLKALERGDKFVTLGDGTQGMLPEEWLAKFAPLANLGTNEDGLLKFQMSQVAILDALLATMASVDLDAKFEEARNRIREFSGIKPETPPATFVGELRVYQQEGLGWLQFLREFGFGGCLADDMGLGKTVQVLALLESRRVIGQQGPSRPSLVVVPRSLVFNWIEEAKRFAPQLRVMDYSGGDRTARLDEMPRYDLVVSTYGTLRRDILKLKDVAFDYVFLDEAQAIKNSQSQSAKACRLLNSRHRIAMTGTPVENHLGELWSICEFLNPGMLGRSQAIKVLTGAARASQSDDSVKLLALALRPFILRRTKQQVLTELPEKTEQTIFCELEGKQRDQYNELRDHYRSLLGNKISTLGLQKSKMDVLTALLRLRQAACHPGLMDKTQVDESSAKIETLLEQLREVLGEGHKVLVFSQFTSLLAIVRKKLDEEKVIYEYLDGKTRDRQEKVHRFQTDPECQLFLISLKAGGHGLNLTAADYVFILDPWWNPAVEAQAIDRAHRIGQNKPVFAYRLIARDTVEEKILLLQSQKRNLAEAIINADNSLLGQLTAEDLELLLS